MNTTTVLLVRHAQTQWNVTGRYMGWIDEDLSEEGIWQAEQLSRRLESRPIYSVYSSPLKRAYRTAQIIAAPHSLPVSPIQELGEIMLGSWEGMSRAEVKFKFPDIWQAWRADPSTVHMPDGESMINVLERAATSFEDIVEANRGYNVLLVTHEVVVKLLIAYCLSVSTSIYRRIEVANASLTIVEITDDMRRLRLLNDTGHLEA